MDGRGVYLRVGLLIVGGTMLLIGMIWFLGSSKIENGTLFESYFAESVQGLDIGAPVKFRGVTVGRVTQIGLVAAAYGNTAPVPIGSTTYRLVYVRYVVDLARIGRAPEIETAIKLGLRAHIAAQGITGVNYIELDFVDPERHPAEQVPWTPMGTHIPSVPSTLAQVQNAAEQLLGRLNQADVPRLVGSLTDLTDDLRTQLDSGDGRAALVAAAQLLQHLNQAATAADVPGLAADLRRTLDALRAVAQDPKLHQMIAGGAQAADRLAAATAQLPALLATTQATLRRADATTADVQAALAPLLRDLQSTLDNLRDMTDSVRRYPAQVLSGAPPPRVAEPAR